MSDTHVLGRQLGPVTYKRLCDLEIAGHNKIIMPGKVAYQVTSGVAQGQYHGKGCYERARKHYEELHKKFVPPQE